MRCQLAPEGYECKRNEDHDGPCILEKIKVIVYAIVEKDWNDDPNVYDTVVDIYWDKTIAEIEAESRTLARKGKRYPDAAYYVQEFEVK